MESLISLIFTILFSSFFVSFVLLHIYIYARRNFSPLSKIPGGSGTFYLGTLKEVVRPDNHISQVLLDYLKQTPDSPFIRYNFVLGENKILVTDPDIIKHMLVTNSSNYTKNLGSYKMVREFVLGRGLVTLDGDEHSHHRGIINEAFNYKYLKNFVYVFALQTKKLTDIWDKTSDGDIVNVQKDLLNVGLNIIGLTSFGFDFDTLSDDQNSEGKSLARQFIKLPKLTRSSLITIIFPFYNYLPLPVNKLKVKNRDELNAAVGKFLRRKHDEMNKDSENMAESKPRDLLEIMFNLKDQNGESLAFSDLVDEAKTFIIAGHETTANAANWTLYLLAQYPEHADIICKEVNDVMGDRELVEPEDLDKFKYLNMVIKESLRIFPPVPIAARYCAKTEELGGYTIPKGTAVSISPFVLHHHPKYWDEPEKFDPLRWTPEKVKERNPYLFFPFFLGPRNCIGQKFGMMELKCVLAMLLRKYEFRLPEGCKVIPKSFISMRATPRIKMHIKHRK